jgi:hypothetical protein
VRADRACHLRGSKLEYDKSGKDMNILNSKFVASVAVLLLSLSFSEPAAAFRCGSKLVQDGMHEAQVIGVCGQPASMRNLGVAVRSYDYRYHQQSSPGWSGYRRPGFGNLAQEVIITEYVYNFGPRKLMQRLIFEGGVLVTIETIGYGYRK